MLKKSKYMYSIVFLGCRLVKEIMLREFQKARQGMAEAPDLTDKELEEGKRMKCPLWWTKEAIEALHEGAEAYMVKLLEDANLLAIHA